MPQLDLSIIASQVFWALLSFSILYVLLTRFTLPRIEKVLDERQDRIDNDIDKATALKTEAELVMEEYNQVLAEAHFKYREILDQTQIEIQNMAFEKHNEVSQKLTQEAEKAEKRINASRAKAMEEIKGVAKQIAVEATNKLTGLNIEESQASTVIEKVTSPKKAA